MKSPFSRRQFLYSAFVGAASTRLAMSATAQPDWIPLFNGKNLSGWKGANGTATNWKVENGLLVNTGRKKGNASWIAHERVFDNFELELEFRFDPGCNSGVFFRTPLEKGRPAYIGNEIQIADMSNAALLKKLTPDRRMGGLYNVNPPKIDAARKPGQWQTMVVRCLDSRCRVTVNGKVAQVVDLTSFPAEVTRKHPGLLRKDGHIGLQSKEVPIEFRAVRIREIH